MNKAEINKRFDHHYPESDEQLSHHIEVREATKTLAAVFGGLPEGCEKALAITRLEEAMFWANAAIARDGQ